MARTFGARNKTKIPQASEIIKYSCQTLKASLKYLDEIINSTSPEVSIKNKMDAIEANRKILDMAGYSAELQAGALLMLSQEGEANKFRVSDQQTTPQSDSLPAKTTDSGPSKETPNILPFVSAYRESSGK